MRFSFIFFFCFFSVISFSQDKEHTSYVDVNYFKGNIALHNNSILHLIKGHPEGYIISWNKKTYGYNNWEKRFNYPDYGVSYAYQNLKNDVLGTVASLYGHYNFYFLKRHLILRVGQGLAYTENPYDKYDNFKNIAFGTAIMSSTYMMLNFKKEHIIDRFGLQAGVTLIHYSNGNVKAPNTSINTITLNVGLTYSLDNEEPEYIAYNEEDAVLKKYTEPLKYNLVFRSGVNESDVVDSGQFPFYIASAYVDKRINIKSAFQLGADVFFSNFLKEHILYRSLAFPKNNNFGDEDYKRVGVFVGHELFINRNTLITQLGYYVYYPFDFEGRVYLRAGLKRYFSKKWFGVLTIKSHGAKAEAVEFGVGVRL
ncbi:acyloxyacyl hydrolase [Mariniflexile ostreae]|uniref:Acyloxyacyl hydrolase n=1 Tax=Mariniflexile ostreae TaxID=1520892 RepID=A0ABV5FBB2_9FLAO